MSDLEKALAYAQSNHERYLSELKEYVRIPSISTLPEHKADLQRTAEWLAAQMQRMGLQNVAVMPTAGHPVVYGEWLEAPGKPTVLVYGHYDVQPVDPLDEWQTPPFEPTVRGDEMYARGPADSKGQSHSVLKALEAYLATGGLPLNVKVMLEGEEEMGSRNLPAFISAHRAKLQSDLFLNTDSGIEHPELPSLVYALRGMAYFELWVYGPSQDLHSGLFGGTVHNPAQVLCELIAGMHDANGHITLPGFTTRCAPGATRSAPSWQRPRTPTKPGAGNPARRSYTARPASAPSSAPASVRRWRSTACSPASPPRA